MSVPRLERRSSCVASLEENKQNPRDIVIFSQDSRQQEGGAEGRRQLDKDGESVSLLKPWSMGKDGQKALEIDSFSKEV